MTRPVRLRVAGATDVGRVRANNQDSYLVAPERALYVVADGMGGAQGGEVASRIAIETIRTAFLEPTPEALVEAVQRANDAIHEAAEDDFDLRGMGTTVTAAALVEVDDHDDDLDHGDLHHEDLHDDRGEADDGDLDEADGDGSGTATGPRRGFRRPPRGGPTGRPAVDRRPTPPPGLPRRQVVVASVGDSRAYLFRQGELTQLTEDHSVVGELVRQGRLDPGEAEHHPQRNILTRVLGVYDQVKVDLWTVDPVVGDRFLLCSDGLFNEVSADRITAVLRRYENDPEGSAGELVRLAVEAGGRDNVTALVIDVVEDEGLAEAASAALAGDLDMAGFTRAGRAGRDVGSGADRGPSRRQLRRARRAERKAPGRPRTRLTWRVVGFVVLLAAVFVGAFYAIVWYATSTFYVGLDGDEVVVYRGRPGGVLWIEPEIEQRTGIMRAELPAATLVRVESQREHTSLAKAEQFVTRVEEDVIDAGRDDTTTTTTTPTTVVPDTLPATPPTDPSTPPPAGA